MYFLTKTDHPYKQEGYKTSEGRKLSKERKEKKTIVGGIRIQRRKMHPVINHVCFSTTQCGVKGSEEADRTVKLS